jgi:hypothetical protein
MAGKVGLLANYAKNEQSSHEHIQKTIREYESMFEELKKMTVMLTYVHTYMYTYIRTYIRI